MTEENENIVISAFDKAEDLLKAERLRDDGENTHYLVPKGKEIQTIRNKPLMPERKTGFKTFHDAKSFCSYVNKHKVENETIITANEDDAKVLAVFDDHGLTDANWREFGAYLDIGFSKQWIEWFNNSHKQRPNLFDQKEFAEHMENNRSDLITGEFQFQGAKVKTVPPLEMTAIIENLKITREEKFESKVNRATNEVKFNYENEDNGKSDIKVPKEFYICLPVYRSGGLVIIKVRLCYDLRNGIIKFYYIIDEMELAKEKAFNNICNVIVNGNKGSEEKEELQFDGAGIEVYQGVI